MRFEVKKRIVMRLTYKKYLIIVVLLALMATGGSFFAQYVLRLTPCPLCIFQRVAIMATGAVALLCLAFRLWSPITRFVASFLVSLPAVFGLCVAIRHLYIQNLPPDKVPACGPGLNFMIKTLPFSEMFSKVLLGSGECAQVEKVLFLPIPAWSLLFFSAILFILWYAFVHSRNRHPFGY